MTRIKDEEFVRTLYRRYCLRPVSDAASRHAILSRRIEVHDVGGDELKISICDAQGSLLDLAWHLDMAWPTRLHPFDEALRDANPAALSRFVRRFLQKHQLIDVDGVPIKRGVA